ncbi:bleomycin hydrolase [Anaeramoeba flamelloides]|uniref:Bleomycin hydrolase n=1 Tax=Anaeramoeba flamelloides TaxID=1746091 RepID=A0ABQ8YWJ6_9EUKA|nr:bleomycin hydrolase [Anaeramoeba flamelloides]
MSIDQKFIQNASKKFCENKMTQILHNSIVNCEVKKLAVNRNSLIKTNHVFSNKLPSVTVTNQKHSGRCWLFAYGNLIRSEIRKKLNVENFEISKTFLFFYDKLEKSNYFLEILISLPEIDCESRLIHFLLGDLVSDGGQFSMITSIVNKYGLCPLEFMPETVTSSKSRLINSTLRTKLRHTTMVFQKMKKEKKTDEEFRKAKDEVLADIYHILALHLGVPPISFNYRFYNKDKKFVKLGEMTPVQFRDEVLKYPASEYVTLVNDPRNEFNTVLTVEHLGNVFEGEKVKYLNVKNEVILEAIKKTIIEEEQPVWFGCDVGKFFNRGTGTLDTKVFDWDVLYNTKIYNGLEKADRLNLRESLMTHAMLFSGIDLDKDDKIQKLQVENSWGKDSGNNGFLSMSVDWFNEFCYEAAILKKFLPENLLEILETSKPKVLPPWDPMGSLAKN